jgi:hypothetical protein
MIPGHHAEAHEAVELTVALVGDPDRQMADSVIPPDEWTKPYEARAKVTLQLGPNATLADAFREASPTFGLRPYHTTFWTAFYKSEDDVDGFFARRTTTVPLLDTDGRLLLGTDYWQVPLARLIVAAERGALEGDPLRPYLLLWASAGDGMPPEWQTVESVWNGVQYVFGLLADVGGAAAALWGAKRLLVDRLQRRSEAAAATARARSTAWQRRGVEPHELRSFLGRRPWRSADLADLLGCRTDEAEAILWAFGFAQSSSGLWHA